MEKSSKKYTVWAEKTLPADLRQQIEEIREDQEQIYDRFCKDLTFGTSGLRGKMGVGSNRINSVVLKRATMGVSDYLLSKEKNPMVVIGYDTRINSKGYASDIAEEFASRGVKVMLFSEPTPVPVLSFAIRHLKANGGIMITASHNPKEYNGYKVYDHFGNQIDDKKARLMEKYINKREYFEEEQDATRGEIIYLDDQVKNAYLEALKKQVLLWDEDEKAKEALSQLSVVYTPLNGAGRDYVMEVLKDFGIKDIKIVEEQWQWDGSFPTCPSPNPEYEKSFDMAMKYAQGADIIIATDPDSDRTGVMARQDGNLKRLTGNQVGELMLDYVCHCHNAGVGGKNLQGQKMAYKSYVSSPITEEIAQSYGVKMKNVPTGFKNIAFEMEKLKEEGREDDFLFGFEESLGYLYGNYTRDKDGILAAQMICLMAASMKQEDKTLFDKLEDLYSKHGYMESEVFSLDYKTEKDREKIQRLMTDLFGGRLETLRGEKVSADLSHQAMNMYKAALPDGHQIIIRPSGTEIKVKIYVFAKGQTRQQARENLKELVLGMKDFTYRYR